MRKIGLLIWGISALTAFGQTRLHVAPEGDDVRGNGSVAAPFASLQKAYDVAANIRGTDTVYIQMAPGDYSLERAVRMQRTGHAPLVVEGSGPGPTVLSGGKRIGGWKIDSRGWWMAQIEEVPRYGWRFEQLFVNGRRAPRARTPDKGFFRIEADQKWNLFGGSPAVSPYQVQRYTTAPENLRSLRGFPIDQVNDVNVTFYRKWVETRQYLSKVVPDSGLLFTQGQTDDPLNSIGKGTRFILENYKGALSMPGEWYLDQWGQLFYLPCPGDQPRTLEVYAPVLSELLHVEGWADHPVSHITFRHLHFRHTAYLLPKTGYRSEQAAALVPAALFFRYAENIHIEDCEVSQTANYGVWFERGCRNCIVEHTLLTDLGAGGVKVGLTVQPKDKEQTSGIQISNNILRDGGKVFPSAVGVAVFHAAENRILHNDISNFPYTGISVGWVWGYGPSVAKRNDIGYNHIHHLGWGMLSDMGGIYLLGPSEGTRVHHNLIHDVCAAEYGGWGIYADEGCSHVLFDSNCVYRCRDGAFHQHYGRENRVQNNILALGANALLQLSKAEPHLSLTFSQNIFLTDSEECFYGNWRNAKVEFDRNLYWDVRLPQPQLMGKSFQQWTAEHREKGAVLADPELVDPLHGDFSFKNRKNSQRIGFQPFDLRRMGVGGSASWKAKAHYPAADHQRFLELYPLGK